MKLKQKKNEPSSKTSENADEVRLYIFGLLKKHHNICEVARQLECHRSTFYHFAKTKRVWLGPELVSKMIQRIPSCSVVTARQWLIAMGVKFEAEVENEA